MYKIKLENSQIPLHYQIADYLLVMLERGDLKSDERIPPEEELKDAFGVSRTTVRRALEHLWQKGLLLRKQGKGTYWTGPALEMKKEKLSGINRQIFNINHQTRVKVLAKRTEKAGPAIAGFLRIPAESPVVVFERLRYIAGEPMSFTVNYLSPECGGRIEKKHLEERTMLETLEHVLDMELGTIEHEVEITRADAGISAHLKIPALDPVLTIRTSVFDTGGSPVEVVWTYFVESKYKFKVILER